MPPQIAEYGPQWLVVAVLVIVVLNYVGRMLSEASESWAKVLGPLGRRWRERGSRRQQERAAERAAPADLKDMRRQRDYLDTELEKCRMANDSRADYIEYDADWHRDLRLRVIESGCGELPQHKSWTQWRNA